jgi:hypothetical protein
LNLAVSEKKITPIFIAIACNKHLNVEAILVNDYEAAYYKNSSGFYPIHYAAYLGHTECVRILAEFDRFSVNF